jgi:SpoVK/Ycf46/Vps4 family AAA+-type ATPase
MSPATDLDLQDDRDSEGELTEEARELQKMYDEYTEWWLRETTEDQRRGIVRDADGNETRIKAEGEGEDEEENEEVEEEMRAIEQLIKDKRADKESKAQQQTDSLSTVIPPSSVQPTEPPPPPPSLFRLSHHLPSMRHFAQAMKTTRPSVTRQEVEEYERWERDDKGK